MHDPSNQPVYERFPFLARAEPSLRTAFFDHAMRTQLAKGTFICMEGNRCAHLPLVVSGTARVYKISEQGREITLYRIAPGESCILTASCVISDRAFPAFAIAETDIDAFAIPTMHFRAWMNQYEGWRAYVFELLATRLSTVMEVVEEVAFHHMDARLASYLLEATGGEGGLIRKTHEAIAADLGTSREVVSRILKEFERKGYLSLSRGAVQVAAGLGLRRHIS